MDKMIVLRVIEMCGVLVCIVLCVAILIISRGEKKKVRVSWRNGLPYLHPDEIPPMPPVKPPASPPHRFAPGEPWMLWVLDKGIWCIAQDDPGGAAAFLVCMSKKDAELTAINQKEKFDLNCVPVRVK